MSAGWEAELTRLEVDLDTHEEALRLGNLTEVPGFEPSPDLGPIPPQLTERAAELLRRTTLLATFVQYQLAATDADLRFERRDVKHAGAQALYLDRAV